MLPVGCLQAKRRAARACKGDEPIDSAADSAKRQRKAPTRYLAAEEESAGSEADFDLESCGPAKKKKRPAKAAPVAVEKRASNPKPFPTPPKVSTTVSDNYV